MITRNFHPNPRFNYLSYNGTELTISFKKGQIRVYECDSKLAYRLFYCTSAAEELSLYSNEIKGKLKVITVK